MKVKFKKLHPLVEDLHYAKPGDAGLDLTAIDITTDEHGNIVCHTGIAVEIPEGYVGLIFPRSSIRKYQIELTNSVGVIDSGYRGEIQFTFNKTAGVPSKRYAVGDRIGQLIIIPYPTIIPIESDILSDTERGQGGFGSTGN